MKRVLSALALAMLAGWLVSTALALSADSPVIVRDGSIGIRHAGGSLRKWQASDKFTLEHPVKGQRMAEIEVTGPGNQAASCSPRGLCVVELQWTSGHFVRITARAGGRGLAIQSSVRFDDAGWNKTGDEWLFKLPEGATPTVTIRDQSTNEQPQVICAGKGCQVTVHYQ